MSHASHSIQVACLCAAWCGTCREYLPAYTDLAARWPAIHFHWVDIEEHADVLDELDVENFPTLLIGVHGEPVFFGVMLPHVQTLERLLQEAKTLRPLPHNPEHTTLHQLLTQLEQQVPLGQ